MSSEGDKYIGMSIGEIERANMGYGEKTTVSMIDIHRAIVDTADEINRALKKFPGKDYNFAALIEEIGELSQALMEHSRTDGPHEKFTPEHIYKEAIQVACMAIRIAVQGSSEYKYENPHKV